MPAYYPSTINSERGTIPHVGGSDEEPENGPAIAGLTLDDSVGPSVLAVNLNITLEQPDKKLALFGSADRYLRMIRDTFGVQVINRDDELKLAGEPDQVSKAAAVLEQMQKKLRRQDWLSVDDVGQAIGRAADDR